jgi:hypothetical protein
VEALHCRSVEVKCGMGTCCTCTAPSTGGSASTGSNTMQISPYDPYASAFQLPASASQGVIAITWW